MKTKLNDLFKRTCSTVLAVACFMSSAAFVPIEKLISVWASNELVFYFIDNITHENVVNGQVTTVLEGISVNVYDELSTISSGYTYHTEYFKPSAPSVTDYVAVGASTANVAYIRPLLGYKNTIDNDFSVNNKNVNFNPVIAYNVSPYDVFNIAGQYSGKYFTNFVNLTDDTTTTTNNSGKQFEARIGLALGTGETLTSFQILEKSNTIKIRYDAGEDTDGASIYDKIAEFSTGGGTSQTNSIYYLDWQLPINNWVVSNDTGYFEDYGITSVLFTKPTSGYPSVGTFNLQKKIKDDDGNWVGSTNAEGEWVGSYETETLRIIVTFNNMESVQSIHDLEFSFDFSYTTGDDSMLLSVIDAQSAVNTIASEITSSNVLVENANYSTNVYDSSILRNNFRPYIYSNNYSLGGENDLELTDIRDDKINLKVRHSAYNYGNGFYIQWRWEPDGLKDLPYLPDAPHEYEFYYDSAGNKLTPDKDSNNNLIQPDGTVNKTEYTEALQAWVENYETPYLEVVDYNDDLSKAIDIQQFELETYANGTYWDDNGDSKLTVASGSSYESNGYMQVAVNCLTNDTPGYLTGEVFMINDATNFKAGLLNDVDGIIKDVKDRYEGYGDTKAVVSNTSFKIPVTVTGTGEKPVFYITETTLATYDENNYTYNSTGRTDTFAAGEQIVFPIYKDAQLLEKYEPGVQYMNMDINNGIDGINTPPATIPIGYEPPIPEAPHTVRGAISFGTGIEKTDRLIVTNTTIGSSDASILMKYYASSTSSNAIGTMVFDETDQVWEIPFTASASNEDEFIYYFEIIAKEEGIFKMQLDFYYEDQSEYKTRLVKEIEIGSSLPSSEAKVDKVYIHLVQDVVDANNLTTEEKRVAEVLDTLYSDKTVSNASDNPLKGTIPTDIIYNVDFEYDSSGFYYYEMELPYVISDVMITPVYEGVAITGGAYTMDVTDQITATTYTVTGRGISYGDYGATSGEIALIDAKQSSLYSDRTKWIEISTLAADNATTEKYYLKLVRQDAESLIVLEDLSVDSYDLLGDNIELSLTNASGTVVQFVSDPVGVGARYYITLPYYYYSQNIPVNINATSNGSWSKSPTITSDDGLSPQTSFLTTVKNALSNSTTETFQPVYLDSYGSGTNSQGSKYPNKFTIRTYSESDDSYADYYLTIYIDPPDTNDDLYSLQVLDPTSDDAVLPFKNGTFVPTKDDYIVEIPYELQKYRFSMLPDSDNALAVRLVAPDGTILGTTSYVNSGTPIQFLVDFNDLGFTSTDLNFTFTIAVQSEDGVWSDQYNHPEGHSPYTILFQRDEPNSNSLLDSLAVLNFETAAPLPEYVFEQVKKDYIFTVPYDTERIIIKPIAVEQARTSITLNGVDFPDDDPGKDYYLTAGETNTFTIVVTAEDPSYTTTYNLYITRSNPDNEARLLNLVVNGADSMTPELFVPSTFVYDVTIPAGTSTYTITPTAVSEYSVITIDGIVIPSGTATGAYNAVDETTTVYVIVSAQDGVTTQTYTLNITNYNLIETSDDCDLLDVNIQGVDLQPTFKSNIYDYEVYTKIDTTTLDITPTISKGASVTVSVGSKKLDVLNGIYSTSFFTDTDKITIVVTSESGKVSKTYTFDVYKNTEGKEGIFEPITDEDVDFKGENPIVVDITSYAVVDASVFNTLKNSYPEKTLVLNGNDYMIRVTGSDISKDVPHTTQYDFGMSFTSPEEPLVQSILDDSDDELDNELEPIYVYFNDHGALPAQMILTLILGSSVGNEQLYWNYYNTEYDRIDYYGYVQSNSKGTITVPIAHFSTYLVSTHQIGASEDRTNTGFGSLDKGNHYSDYLDGGIGTENFGDDLTGGFGTGGSGGDISGELTTNKPNPQTEADYYGFPLTNSERGVYEQTTVYKWYEEKRNKNEKDENNENDDLEEC